MIDKDPHHVHPLATRPSGLPGQGDQRRLISTLTIYGQGVPQVLIASDSAYVTNQVLSVLSPETDRVVVTSGPAVLDQVRKQVPDIALIDFQIGNMGGMATCLDLRLEHSADRLPHVPVLLMLDRRADVFLARRSQAQGWLIKPLEPFRTRRAINKVLAGEDYHDPSYLPDPVSIAPTAD